MKKAALFFTNKNNKECQELQYLVENMIKSGCNFEIIDVNSNNENIKKLNVKKEAVPQFAMFQDDRHIFSTTAVHSEKELKDFYEYDKFWGMFNQTQNG